MSTPGGSGPRSLHDLADHVPGDVHCRQVLEEVYLYLDGEISGPERAAIKQHLDECSPCLQRYGIEHEVKALIARCHGHERAPGHLRERVLTTLRTVTVTGGAGSVSVTTTTTTVVSEPDQP